MLPFLDRVFLGANGDEGVLHISQSSRITGTSPSDCLVSYPGHSLLGPYPSAEVQSVYFTAPVDWAMLFVLILNIFLMMRSPLGIMARQRRLS